MHVLQTLIYKMCILFLYYRRFSLEFPYEIFRFFGILLLFLSRLPYSDSSCLSEISYRFAAASVARNLPTLLASLDASLAFGVRDYGCFLMVLAVLAAFAVLIFCFCGAFSIGKSVKNTQDNPQIVH